MLDSCPTCLEKFYNAEVLKASLTYRYSIVVNWLHQFRVGQEEDGQDPPHIFQLYSATSHKCRLCLPYGHSGPQEWAGVRSTGSACSTVKSYRHCLYSSTGSACTFYL